MPREIFSASRTNVDVNHHFDTNSHDSSIQSDSAMINYLKTIFICINVTVSYLINMQFIHDYYTLQF